MSGRASLAGLVAAEVVVANAELVRAPLSDRASLGCFLIIGVVLAPEAEARREDTIPDHASSASLVAGVFIATVAFSDVSVSSDCVNNTSDVCPAALDIC